MAEIDPRVRQPLLESPLREDVDAHAGQVALGLARLLVPLHDPARVVHRQDPHPGRIREGHPADGYRHVGPMATVGGHERLVVHLVDVVAGQHKDCVAGCLPYDIEILEDCVGGASVPLRDAASGDIRLEHPNAAGVAVQVPRPAHADVVVQGTWVVLGQDDDVVDVRVHAVGQREVDDPVLAAKRNGRLGPHRR